MAPDEPLPSWNDTPTRAAIMEFVARVTGDGPDQLPAQQRVATFDNDGTPWCEKPMPIQLDFTIRRIAAMAEADATLRDQQPWKAAYEHDLGWLGTAMVKHYHGDDSDLALLMTAVPQAFGGLTVEAYADEVDRFFRAADHPQLGRPYMTCGYVPMLELAPLPRGSRVRRIHRLGRRPGLHATRGRRPLRGAAGAGDRQLAHPRLPT
jgi:hypothetical protein